LAELDNYGPAMKARQDAAARKGKDGNGNGGNGGNGKDGNGNGKGGRLAELREPASGVSGPEARHGGSAEGTLAAASAASMPPTAGTAFKVKCPECGGMDVVYGEGCAKCLSCGWGKC